MTWLIIKALIVGVCTIVVLLSPIFKVPANVLNNLRLIASVLIVCIGVRLIEEVWGFSWLISLIIATIFLMLISWAAKAIESFTTGKK